jgi:signal transduction histidine kinase
MDIGLIEREITDLPPLNQEESSLVDMHTLLNVLNVLHGELALIGLALARDSDALRGALGVCNQWLADLRDAERVRRAADTFPALRSRVMSDVARLLAQHPEKEDDPELIESRANLDSVFLILDLYMRELLARWRQPDLWVPMSLAQLRLNLVQVFAAMGKNSRGRFRIIYDLAMQAPSDYYVKLDFQSTEGDTATMPPVLHDVIRDLLANARKYTKPGGTITAGFYATPEALKLVVQDTGRGIPKAELAEVVKFGRRGSNVGDVRTMGAGFGLTKAYYVTKQFGGRMWVASRLGVGTRIKIVIPRPSLSS